MIKYTPRYVEKLPLADITKQIVRNPKYGGEDSGIYGWPVRDIIYRGIKPLFMEALCESILEEGYRNPIICYATDTGTYLSFGGSRIHCGRKVGMEWIPAIVNDYAERFTDCPEVTEENYAQFFTDIPRYFEITEEGADYHYALERKRRSEYDPAGFAWSGEDAEFIDIHFPWVNEGLDSDPLPRKASREAGKLKLKQQLPLLYQKYYGS